jgi:succinyl-diaminopimelate desuccinylase
MTAQLVETTRRLLEIPSVTGEEKEIADQVEAWMREIKGYDVRRFMDSVIVTNLRADHRPTVTLVGHLDTVPPQGAFPTPRIEGDRLHGLGASDMLSGVGIMVEIARTWQDGPIVPHFVFYHSEEKDFAINGLKFILEEKLFPKTDLALVLEPTDGTIQMGCVGLINISLRVKGQAAHSARPWQGDNAVTKAGALLSRFHAFGYRDRKIAGLLYRDTMQITLASAGISRNILPPHFDLHVNLRFAPDQTLEEAYQRFVDFLKEDPIANDLSWEIVDQAYAGKICDQNPLLSRLEATTQAPREPKQAWTDVAQLSAHGIDAINYGPGLTAQAHQADEYASISLLQQTYKLLLRFLSE